MKKIDLKSLVNPFCGSVAHSVCAVAAVLTVTAGLILAAHLVMHVDRPDDSETSSYSDSALKAEMEKAASDLAESEAAQ